MLDTSNNTTQAMYTKQSAGAGLSAVTTPAAAQPVAPVMSAPATPPTPSNQKKKSNLAALIGGGLLLLFLVVGGLLVYRFTQTDQTTAPTQSSAGSCTVTFIVPEAETPTSATCAELAVNESFSSNTIPSYFELFGDPANPTFSGSANFSINGGPGGVVGVITKEAISDDFDTQVKVTNLSKATGDSNSAELRLNNGIVQAEGRKVVFLAVRWVVENGVTKKLINTNYHFEGVATGDAQNFYVPVAQENEPVELRLSKANGQVMAYYKIGNGAWTLLATYERDMNEPFKVDLAAGSFVSNPAVSASFDDFSITCGEESVALSCRKSVFQDELSNTAGTYQFLTEKTTFNPGDVVVYRVIPGAAILRTMNIDLTDTLGNNLTFMDSNCGANAYNATTKVLTCSGIAGEAYTTFAFRARVNANVANGTVIKNTAQVEASDRDDVTSATCEVDITVNTTTTTTYSCNSACTTDAQCESANGDYVCFDSGNGRFCRLDSNTSSTTCQPGTGGQTYSCNSTCTTDEQCRGANASYVCIDENGSKYCRLDSNRSSTSCTTPTNTYACNSTCTTNEQCQSASSSYVCYDTGSGKYCRNQSYVAQTNCLAPNQPTPTPTIGCNQTCATNADCSNPDHICYSTESGMKCRLADYVNSASCTKPGTTSTTTPTAPTTPTSTTTTTPVNPEDVAELPVAGTQDLVKMLGAGAAALVLGGLFILLLL